MDAALSGGPFKAGEREEVLDDELTRIFGPSLQKMPELGDAVVYVWPVSLTRGRTVSSFRKR
jgi:hypothetical protein